jgi:hypothetical protein
MTMDWQSLAVIVIVAAAVLFLLRHFVMPPRRRSRSAETFIPLARIKKRQDRCH